MTPTLDRIRSLFRRPSVHRAEPMAAAGDGASTYRAPGVIDAGRARDLITGGTGKHTDGYSAYYHNAEG